MQKQQVSRTNSLALTKNSNSELLFGEHTLPQEVGEKHETGGRFVKKADSKRLPDREIMSNLIKKYSALSHPQFVKMDPNTRE